MTVDHLQPLRSVRAALSQWILPIHYLANWPSRINFWISEHLQAQETLIEQNKFLRHQHHILQAQLQQLTVLEKENTHLHTLLNSSPRVGKGRIQIAELLSADSEPFNQTLLLNKGSQSQVFLGQPVLDPTGVIGQIIDITPKTSRVLLITDTRSAIPVKISRTGLRATAIGVGANTYLELAYITNTTELRIGDWVVTSELAEHYPAGYPVGRIASVKHVPGERFALIKITPSAKFDRDTSVLLFWKATQS